MNDIRIQPDTDQTKLLSPDDRPAPKTSKPRKPRGLWWVIKWGLAIIVPMIVLIVLLNFRMGPGKGQPLVRISRQTTYATSPLKPSGDVDYIAYLNQQHAVTPANNAFVDLLRIKGPVVANKMPPPEFFQLLGIAPLPATGDYFVEFPFTPKTAGLPLVMVGDAALNSEEVYRLTTEIPYPAGQFPVVDEWIAKHSHHFEAMRLAVRKPGFYLPYVGDTIYYSEEFLQAHGMRTFARGLQRSSMARLGQGDVAGAIDDQVAMLQLARHVGHQGTLVEPLIATVIEGMAHAVISQTIFSDYCTPEDLARLAAELKSLSASSYLSPLHLQTERVSALDCAINIGRYGPIPWESKFSKSPGINDQSPTFRDQMLRASIDWETVCITLNETFDKLEAALATDGAARAPAINGFEAELRAIKQEFGTPQMRIQAAAAGRGSRSRLAGNILLTLMIPTVNELSEADMRVTAQHSLNEVAVALQRFRLEHGKYPRQLEELVPGFLAEVPLDRFYRNPLVYKPDTGDPFLLYSLGPNINDDGGVGMIEAQNNQYDLVAAPKVRTVDAWIKKNKQSP